MPDPSDSSFWSYAAAASAINLQHIRFAVAADDCRSFRRAADLLSVRHSFLSRSIRQLEQIIGTAMFERSSSGVRPTLAGRGVLRIARLTLEQIDAIVETGRSAGCGEAGRLSIGFSTSMSAGNLRASLLEFRKRFSRINLMTVERSRIHLASALRSGKLDIVISPGGPLLADCKILSLWSERILLSLPEAHVLNARKVVSWIDLGNEKVLLSKHDPGRELEELIVSKFLSAEDRPKIERHDVSRGIVKSLTSMGLGVSLVLESDVGATFAGLTYRELRDGTGPSRIDFCAHWRDDNENPALDRFVELLAERYPSLPPVG